MDKPQHHRKREELYASLDNPSPNQDKEESYTPSDWTGTLKLFSLYPLLFLFYITPVIFNLNGFRFYHILNFITIYFVLGCLLARILTFLFPVERPIWIRNGLIASETLIVFCFLIYSFSVYIHPYSPVQSFLWFLLGIASTYHSHFEQNFVTKILNYKPKWVSTLLESPEVMMQAFAHFILLFFLMIFFPFLMSAMLSFFFYTKDNFNTFLPLTFGNLILIFILIYHTVSLSLDPRVKKKLEEKDVKLSLKDLLIKPIKLKSLRNRNGFKISTEKLSYFLFNLGALPPLFGLTFFFIFSQERTTNHVNVLLNLAIISSLSLTLKAFLFFYSPPYLEKMNLKRLSSTAMGFFIILLIFYIYVVLELTFNIYLITFLFLGLRFVADLIWVTSLYLQRNAQGNIKVESTLLRDIFPILPTPILLAIGLFTLVYPLVADYGIYFISIILVIFALSLSNRADE